MMATGFKKLFQIHNICIPSKCVTRRGRWPKKAGLYHKSRRSPISALSKSMVNGISLKEALARAEKEVPPLPHVRRGIVRHKALAFGLPLIDKSKLLAMVRSGKRFSVREVTIFDPLNRISGRIDELRFTSAMVDGKHECHIVEDKFPIKPFQSAPKLYRMQLDPYTCLVHQACELQSTVTRRILALH